MIRLLLAGKRSHSAVYLEVVNNACLSSDELVEKLVYRVFIRKQIELFVKNRDCRIKDGSCGTRLVILIEVRGAFAFVDW